MRRLTQFGMPRPVRPSSGATVLIPDLTLGFYGNEQAADLPPGATPASVNVVLRDGYLEPRPMLVPQGNVVTNPLGQSVTGGYDAVSVEGQAWLVASGTTGVAVYETNNWTALSLSTGDPPNTTADQYWDMTQVFVPDANENAVYLATGSYQTLYEWVVGAPTYSQLTDGFRARYVTAFDNFLLGFNVAEGNARYVQRVAWTDRGNPRVATPASGNLAGFEDLLDMRGEGTRIVTQEGRVILFSTREIWQGVRAGSPFIFSFSPLDRSTGCPYPWTVATTRLGIMFLGADLNVHLLPKDGGTAQAVGGAIHRYLRDAITSPERAWAVYDRINDRYELYYPVTTGAAPTRALVFHLERGVWAPQEFTIPMTRGFDTQAPLVSGVSWGGATGSWSSATGTWADYVVRQEQASIIVGTSSGTLYRFSPSATSDSGTTVTSTWRTHGLLGQWPDRRVLVQRVQLEYRGSAASLGIRVTPDNGATFPSVVTVSLASTAAQQMVKADVRAQGQYPEVELRGTGERWRIGRVAVTTQPQGQA